MTQHPPRSPTPDSEPEDLDQEISWKLKILDFATLVLSHPSMTQAVREMATKDLGTATKKMTSPTDPSMPGTSASSTNTQPTLTNTTLSTGRAYTMPSRQVKKNWQDSQKEKVILRRKKEKKKKERFEETSKSPGSKHPDLRVALALDEIFGTLLGETTVSATSKLKQE